MTTKGQSASYSLSLQLSVMPRFRPYQSLQVLVHIAVLGGIIWLMLHIDQIIPQPAAPPPTPEPKYSTYPTYEYTSVYRQDANRTFEAALDSQLIALEQSVRNTLAPDKQSLTADLAIHQITNGKLAGQMKNWVNQWRTNNPGWSYNLITTTPTELLSLFSNIPSITSAFNEYPALRPDLARYLLLWYHGGFYTDIRSWERVSLQDCSPIIDVIQGGKDVSLMVGIDRDEPFYDQETLEAFEWSRGFGFSANTIWAVKRFDPVLRTTIARSISHTLVKKKLDQGRQWKDLFAFGLAEAERSEISGAGMLTDAVLDALTAGRKDDSALRDRDAGIARRVSWKKLKGRKDTIWVEPSQAREGSQMPGIGILPIMIWGNGQNHSQAGSYEEEAACINQVRDSASYKEWYEKVLW